MPDCIIKLPNVGDTICYKMRSSDSPVEPDREWRGRVMRVYPKTFYSMGGVKVESLEEGHEEEVFLQTFGRKRLSSNSSNHGS